MKRLIQITIVAVALTVLASYVIYSQRRHAPRIAPGSKSPPAVLNEFGPAAGARPDHGKRTETNAAAPNFLGPTKPVMVAPGSKSDRVIVPEP